MRHKPLQKLDTQGIGMSPRFEEPHMTSEKVVEDVEMRQSRRSIEAGPSRENGLEDSIGFVEC